MPVTAAVTHTQSHRAKNMFLLTQVGVGQRSRSRYAGKMGAASSKGGACCAAPVKQQQDERIKTHAFSAAELAEVNAGGAGVDTPTASAAEPPSPEVARELVAGLNAEEAQPATDDVSYVEIRDVQVRATRNVRPDPARRGAVFH